LCLDNFKLTKVSQHKKKGATKMNLESLELEQAYNLKQYENTLVEIMKLEAKARQLVEYAEAIQANIEQLKGAN
jgi:hypothetical protein